VVFRPDERKNIRRGRLARSEPPCATLFDAYLFCGGFILHCYGSVLSVFFCFLGSEYPTESLD